MKLAWAIYVAGVGITLWRTDASLRARVPLAVLWPLGPIAFVVTVAILLAASLIAFPLVAGGIALVVATAAWWFMSR